MRIYREDVIILNNAENHFCATAETELFIIFNFVLFPECILVYSDINHGVITKHFSMFGSTPWRNVCSTLNWEVGQNIMYQLDFVKSNSSSMLYQKTTNYLMERKDLTRRGYLIGSKDGQNRSAQAGVWKAVRPSVPITYLIYSILRLTSRWKYGMVSSACPESLM